MKDENKTKKQLIIELVELRKRVAEMELTFPQPIQRSMEASCLYEAINSTVSGIIIANPEGRIVYVNPAFLRMFKYKSKEEVYIKHASDLFASQKVQKFSDVEAIIDNVKGETEEFKVRRKDGTEFPVKVTSSVVTDKDGKNVGRMASFEDITEREKAKGALYEYADRIEDLLEKRTQ